MLHCLRFFVPSPFWDHRSELLSANLTILAKARDENRTIITFDLDFGDLLAAAGIHLPSVVILRLHNPTPLSVTRKLLEILPLVQTKLETGAVIIVEEGRFRVRELPIVLE